MTRTTISLGLFAAAAALSLAPTARADDMKPDGAPPAPPPPSGRFFDTYDTNQDGRVTKDEYMAATTSAGQPGDPEVFALLDKSGDGVVTLDELGLPADYKPRPLPPPREEPRPDAKGAGLAERLKKFQDEIAAMDKDKDGKVSREEYVGKKIPFDLADRNKDGFVTMEDLRGGGRPGGKGAPNMDERAAQFRESDKNGDGKIGKDEFPGPAERFTALDKDGDGLVTKEEFFGALRGGEGGGLPGKGMRPGKMLERFDKNADGKVTRDEFPGDDATFQRLDKNADGAITPEEAMADRPAGKDGVPPGKRPGGETPGPDDGMAPPPAPPAPGTLPPLFAMLDRNHDGKISREEFPGSDDDWRKMDRDANGWITPEESAR